MQGYDVTQHVLACFGGAGGQHACAIATALGMKVIFVHRYAGILSAVGIGLAEVVEEAQEPSATVLSKETIPELEEKIDILQERALSSLHEQGFQTSKTAAQRFLNLRYDGTDVPVMTPSPEDGDYASAFEASYKREFGFVLEGRDIIVDDLRVRATGKSTELSDDVGTNNKSALNTSDSKIGDLPQPAAVTSAYFDIGGRQDTPAYLLG